MADVNNNAQQRLADRNTIKNWFKKGLKPLQEHFWTWIDSYWHKSDKLPISSIQDLGATLDNKSNVDHIHIQYTTPEIVQSMIDNQRSSIYRLMSPVATYADLPMDGNLNGDVRNVIDTGMNYVWDGAEWDALGGLLDLTNYVTQTQFITALSDMATQTWVNQQLANVSVDLSGYYTADDIDALINDMATQTWVSQQIASIISGGQIDLDGYATQTWVQSQGYLTNAILTGYATQSWVNSQGYITNSALSGYATQSWVTSQGYITNSALSGYATQSWVSSQLSSIPATGLYFANGALNSNRDVSLNGFKLNFSGGITKIDTLELGQKTSNLLPRVLFTNGKEVCFTDENGVTWILLRKVDRVRWGKALTPIDEDITISSYRGLVINERCKIKKFHITAGTPPTGSGIVVGMQKNNVTITTVNATILPNNRTSASNSTQPSFSSDTFEIGDRIDFFIPAGGIGSVNAGQNLEVYLEFELL